MESSNHDSSREEFVRRLEYLINAIRHGVIVTSSKGVIRYWNEGASILTGYSRQDAIGGYITELIPEIGDPDSLETGNKQVRIKNPESHKHKWLELGINYIQATQDEEQAWVFSLCDIHFQKTMEEELQESRARARAILETTVDGIITINEKGIIESVNQAVEKIFGYSRDELVGNNVSMLMPAPYRDEHDEYLDRYHRTGEKHIIGKGREVRGLRKDGRIFPMELAVSEVTWDHHKLFAGSIKDISERRNLEKEIIEISDEERRRIGQDLHDGLGQMLTGTALMSQNLARKLEANNISAAKEAVELTHMIRDADQYARTLSHSLIPVEMDQSGMQSSLAQLCKRACRLFNITCEFQGDDSITIQSQNTAIHVYRIAQEAISNAVKHGQADEIWVQLLKTDYGVLLRIEDNGSGFDQAKRKNSQKGMGIHTMRYRAHISGGEFQIYSSTKGNTIVECRMPLPSSKEHIE